MRALTALLLASCASGQTDYLRYVRGFADTMLAAGTDAYGPKRTPLWAGVIDARTLEVPAKGVPAPAGVRESDRAVGGANLYHDAVTLRVFRALSAQTGEARYATAAREYMAYFLHHARNPRTGFLGWGEHLYYDFFRDEVAAERRWHELLEWTPPWEDLWAVDPEAVTAAIGALRYHYYRDDPAALYNRHAYWDRSEHQPTGGQPWIKHSGLYAYSFAFLYSKTKDARWLEWARGAASPYWDRRNPSTDLTLSCIDDPRPGSKQATGGMALLAYWLGKAYEVLPAEKRLRERALAFLEAYDRFAYSKQKDAYWAGLELDGRPAGAETIPPWNFAYGSSSIIPYGRIAAWFARREHKREYLEIARRVARITRATPLPERVSLEGLGFALNLSLDVYEQTRNSRYLEDARHYAGVAIEKFWVPNPKGGLFVREPGDRYYEAKVGTGDLLAGLLRLHAATQPKVRGLGVDWSF